MTDPEDQEGASLTPDSVPSISRRRLLQVQTGGLAGFGLLESAVQTAEASSITDVHIEGPGETTLGTTEEYSAYVSKPVTSETYLWYVDGEFEGYGSSINLSFEDVGDRTLSVTVKQDQTIIGHAETTVSVAESPPQVRVCGPTTPAPETTTYTAKTDRVSDDAEYEWTVVNLRYGRSTSHTGESITLDFGLLVSYGISVTVTDGDTTLQDSLVAEVTEDPESPNDPCSEGGSIPDPVDVSIDTRDEVVVDRSFAVEAVPGNTLASFERLEWSVPSADETDYDVDGDGLSVDVTLETEDEHTLRLDYETEEGYEDFALASVTSVDVERYADRKMALAEEVTRLSVGINERSKVAATVDSLEDRAVDGTVAPTDARDALNRLRLAEDVTEKALAGMGEGVAASPEEDLVGEPVGSIPASAEYEHPDLPHAASVNVAGETIGSIAWFILGALGGAAAVGKVASKLGFIDELSDADEVLLGGIEAAASLLTSNLADEIVERVREVNEEMVDLIITDEMEDGDEILQAVNDQVGEIRNDLGDVLQSEVERTGTAWSSMESHLEELHDAMSGGGSGDVYLDGSQEGAEAAAETGRYRTLDELETSMRGFTTTDMLTTIADILGLAALILLAGSVIGAPVAAAIGILSAFLALSAEFMDTFNGATTMFTFREIHEQTIEGIIAGEDWT